MSALSRRALLRTSATAIPAALHGRGVAAHAQDPLPAPAEEQPSADAARDWVRVYLIVIDGLRPDEVPQMPTLSALAADGWYFPEARAQMIAETTPNHVSMITGMRVDRHGMPGNDVAHVPDDVGLQPRYLQADTIYSLIARQAPDLIATAATSKAYIVEMTKHMRVDRGTTDADATNDPFIVPVSEAALDVEVGRDALEQSRTYDPDFAWVSFGDVDRAGHSDETGATGGPPAFRSAVLQSADQQVAALVGELQESGRWASSVVLVTADHSMDWSRPDAIVSLTPAFEEDPDLAGHTGVANNYGAAMYWLLAPEAAGAGLRLKRMRDIALATEGVAEAWYTRPNPDDGGQERWVGRARPDWGLTGDRTGDLVVVAAPGFRITEPAPHSNPVPGTHGHIVTLPIPLIVAGGWDGIRGNDAVAGVGGAVPPDVRVEGQAENIDMAPTVAWLLGINPPPGGFDGRVLTEPFTRRPSPRVPVADVPSVPRYGEAAGASRYGTAAALSRQAFPDAEEDGEPAADALVVASGEAFPDALAATPLAAAVGGPLLLTASASLPEETAVEIRRLAPSTVYVVGGPAAIADGVLQAIGALGVESVRRIAGASRYGTAQAIAATILQLRAEQGQPVPGVPAVLPPGTRPDVILASGESFADALVAGPLAAISGRLILLTRPGSLPEETAAVISEIRPARVLIVGGSSVVSAAVESAVGADALVERLAGPTRFDTAAAVVERTIREGGFTDRAFLVDGTGFPDALAAGAAVARLGGMLLPVSPAGLRHSGGVAELLLRRADGLVEVTWVGGADVLPAALREGVEARILLTRSRGG